jgi:hypothetical protein
VAAAHRLADRRVEERVARVGGLEPGLGRLEARRGRADQPQIAEAAHRAHRLVVGLERLGRAEHVEAPGHEVRARQHPALGPRHALLGRLDDCAAPLSCLASSTRLARPRLVDRGVLVLLQHRIASWFLSVAVPSPGLTERLEAAIASFLAFLASSSWTLFAHARVPDLGRERLLLVLLGEVAVDLLEEPARQRSDPVDVEAEQRGGVAGRGTADLIPRRVIAGVDLCSPVVLHGGRDRRRSALVAIEQALGAAAGDHLAGDRVGVLLVRIADLADAAPELHRAAALLDDVRGLVGRDLEAGLRLERDVVAGRVGPGLTTPSRLAADVRTR